MNNIEILEERINFCKNNTECREELNQCFGCTFEIEEIQAIENLIQENKELEEERDNLIIQKNADYYKISKLKDDLDEVEGDRDYNYIPKSKLKEIIYPTPENYIPLEVQSSEMYKKLEKLVEGE